MVLGKSRGASRLGNDTSRVNRMTLLKELVSGAVEVCTAAARPPALVNTQRRRKKEGNEDNRRKEEMMMKVKKRRRGKESMS